MRCAPWPSIPQESSTSASLTTPPERSCTSTLHCERPTRSGAGETSTLTRYGPATPSATSAPRSACDSPGSASSAKSARVIRSSARIYITIPRICIGWSMIQTPEA